MNNVNRSEGNVKNNKFEYFKSLVKAAESAADKKAIRADWSLTFYGPMSHKMYKYSFNQLMTMGARKFVNIMYDLELESDKYGIVKSVDDYYYDKAVKQNDHSVYCF